MKERRSRARIGSEKKNSQFASFSFSSLSPSRAFRSPQPHFERVIAVVLLELGLEMSVFCCWRRRGGGKRRGEDEKKTNREFRQLWKGGMRRRRLSLSPSPPRPHASLSLSASSPRTRVCAHSSCAARDREKELALYSQLTAAPPLLRAAPCMPAPAAQLRGSAPQVCAPFSGA